MKDLIGWKPYSLNPISAGVRYRCLNPLRELQDRGYPVELFSWKSRHRYAAVVYQGLSVFETDVKTGSPATLLEEASRLKAAGTRIVVEDCDNHFYNPRQRAETAEGITRLRSLIALADELVVSTPALAQVMRSESREAITITVIGDAVESSIVGFSKDTLRRSIFNWKRWRFFRDFTQLSRHVRDHKVRGRTPLVWFGNHGSNYADGGMDALVTRARTLQVINQRYPLALTVISNNKNKYLDLIAPWHLPTNYLTWSRLTFLEALRLHDIAIIPIAKTPFTICKSNNRLTLALHEGLAVVADSIPSYEPFSAVCYLDNWDEGLARYLESPQKRQAHVSAARRLIAQECSLAIIADRWQHLFDRLLSVTR